MRIRVKNADGEKVHELSQTLVTVGRGKQCELSLVGEGISRQHLKIEQRGGKFFAQDLGSTNGSSMAGKKMIPNEWVEFTSLFPIEIGNGTQLILETAVVQTSEDSTQIRVRKKLQEKLGNKRKEKKS